MIFTKTKTPHVAGYELQLLCRRGNQKVAVRKMPSLSAMASQPGPSEDLFQSYRQVIAPGIEKQQFSSPHHISNIMLSTT